MTRKPDPLRGLRPTRPPAGLGARAVEAARRAALDDAQGWLDRAWTSPLLRWGWALSVAALVLAHLALGLDPGRSPDASPQAETVIVEGIEFSIVEKKPSEDERRELEVLLGLREESEPGKRSRLGEQGVQA